jgi:hypothetical protein
VVACCRRASVSASAGAAWSCSKIPRACAGGVRPRVLGRVRSGNDLGRGARTPAPARPRTAPAIGGVRVCVRGSPQVPPGLGEGGVRRDEGVLGVRVAGLEAADEPFGERELPDLKRRARHRGEEDRVVGVVAGARVGLDLGQERGRRLILTEPGVPGRRTDPRPIMTISGSSLRPSTCSTSCSTLLAVAATKGFELARRLVLSSIYAHLLGLLGPPTSDSSQGQPGSVPHEGRLDDGLTDVGHGSPPIHLVFVHSRHPMSTRPT